MEIDYKGIFEMLPFDEAADESCKLAVEKVMADVEFRVLISRGLAETQRLGFPPDMGKFCEVTEQKPDGSFQIMMDSNWFRPPFELNELIF